MRIAHADRSKVKLSTFHYDIPDSRSYRDIFVSYDRRSHIYGDIISISSQDDDSFCDLDTDFVFFGESACSYILEKASCPVSTHLDLTPILVIYTIAKISLIRVFYHEYLITSHSEMPVSKFLCYLWIYLYLWVGYPIEYDEVIAEAMHFSEGDFHG
jgi:hypothetical protein